MPALQNKEVNLINPATVNLSIVQTANQVPGTTKVTIPGLEFEHFDFNEADPYLARVAIREAIAHGVNRPALIARTVGEISKGIKPLGSRMYVSTQPQYKATAFAYSPSQSNVAAEGAGLHQGLRRLLAPELRAAEGPGPDLHDPDDLGQQRPGADRGAVPGPDEGDRDQDQHPELRRQTFFGTNLVQGTYQIGEFAWVPTPFVSANQSIYCSYTNTAKCGQNWIHYANSAGGQPDGRGFRRAERLAGDSGLQQDGRHPVARHGDAAAVPEAPVLGLVQQPEERAAEHCQCRHHLERRKLVARLGQSRSDTKEGRAAIGSSLLQLLRLVHFTHARLRH